jgi:hypothetical protein
MVIVSTVYSKHATVGFMQRNLRMTFISDTGNA